MIPQSCATCLHLLNFWDPRAPVFKPGSMIPFVQTGLTPLNLNIDGQAFRKGKFDIEPAVQSHPIAATIEFGKLQ